jgi:hypothetical protein
MDFWEDFYHGAGKNCMLDGGKKDFMMGKKKAGQILVKEGAYE